MKIFERGANVLRASRSRKVSALLLAFTLLFAAGPLETRAAQDQGQPAPSQTAQGPAYPTQSPEQLQQLVAPIALYPDSLVAQILAASTFPEQVVEADRWVQNHPDLKGDALAQAVDQEPWDPSVKALTAFPAVLGNMDKNLSWTSSLGDAYYNQQQDVADAIQVMRQKAEQAGNLRSTPQQTVTSQGPTITIEPAAPDVVYVPAYDPWLVYGPPLVAWPGWYPYPGIWFGGPHLFFGVGFGIGFFGGYGWGWNHWGYDWHHHYAVYNHERFVSRSTTFYNRNVYYRGGRGGVGAPGRGGFRPQDRSFAAHGNVYNRPGGSPRPFEGNNHAARGFAQPRGQSNVRSGAFSGYDHGGESRSYSARGSASVGGGGSRGGGAPHGGGAPRGGGGPHH